EDRYLAVSCVRDRPLEVVGAPGRASVPGGGDQQGMIKARLVGEATAVLVGVLGRATPARESNAQSLEDREGTLVNGIAGVGKADRLGNAVLLEAGIEGAHLGGQITDGLVGYRQMVARVVADLETVLVQLGDFRPAQVVLLVGGEVPA